MSEKRKSVKDRLKDFFIGTEAKALSLTSPPLPGAGMGTSGQAESQTNVQSAAKQGRKENKSSTTHTRDKPAAHTGPQYSYSSTTDNHLMNSFGISDLPTSPVSLASPVTSPTLTSPNPYPSLQLDERSSK